MHIFFVMYPRFHQNIQVERYAVCLYNSRDLMHLEISFLFNVTRIKENILYFYFIIFLDINVIKYPIPQDSCVQNFIHIKKLTLVYDCKNKYHIEMACL